jgi:CBS domain-containing protein
MADAVCTASPDWSLEHAAAEMSRRGIRHLVVVDDGNLVGMLSMRDIVRVWTSDGATSEMPAS